MFAVDHARPVSLLILADRKTPGREKLTERQKQVVQLLAEGRAMKEVGSHS